MCGLNDGASHCFTACPPLPRTVLSPVMCVTLALLCGGGGRGRDVSLLQRAEPSESKEPSRALWPHTVPIQPPAANWREWYSATTLPLLAAGSLCGGDRQASKRSLLQHEREISKKDQETHVIKWIINVVATFFFLQKADTDTQKLTAYSFTNKIYYAISHG